MSESKFEMKSEGTNNDQNFNQSREQFEDHALLMREMNAKRDLLEQLRGRYKILMEEN